MPPTTPDETRAYEILARTCELMGWELTQAQEEQPDPNEPIEPDETVRIDER